ncbi:MAG: phosphotransferase family protein [Lachnospirales bacterium]
MISKTKSLLDDNSIELLVKKNFGEYVEVERITEFSEGFFNAVYCVEFTKAFEGHKSVVLKTGIGADKYVLTYEKDIMSTEIQVYEKLSRCGVPIPKILFTDFSRQHVNFDYFFMEKLEGLTWEKAENLLTDKNREKLYYELGKYTAMIHNIKGDYYGYIKKDKSYQHSSWKEAFISFIDNIIEDGIKGGVELPFEDIYKKIEPFFYTLDDVKEPSLVNYDMWSKNIILNKIDGEYAIEGIIDHERAFFGDPIAEFISTQTICGDLENATMFKDGYSKFNGSFFEMNKSERIRFMLYNVYMGLLMGVEIYRYDESDISKFMDMSRTFINTHLEKLDELKI